MSASFPLTAGKSDEWFTPPEIFDALNCQFDLDVAQPSEGRAFLSVPCRQFLTKVDDGLVAPWSGFVWMNPPFGGRNGVVRWLDRFVAHGNGIALVNALTSSGWFQDFSPKMDALIFPRGKTRFVRPDGSRGESPQSGIVLMGIGKQAADVMRRVSPTFGLRVEEVAS
ncbi:DNA N-6-adenine-methyltransferase [Acetobacter sp. UBA5411]|uniref:DNA N-6-adenine-methyltransferase n=1 Tax=Acetobacter sp. UBA5411 TaxID=1945905 RepID=UPI0025C6B492|nr:DNA N-6-adenine-methyltransferase [Acetobacter sp. UBA5411]